MSYLDVLEQMEVADYYGGSTTPNLVNIYRLGIPDIKKAAGMIGVTAGEEYKNDIYGAAVWRQMNVESNFLGFIPKVKWLRSGVRVWTEFATSGIDDVAMAENGDFSQTYYPTIKKYNVLPKIAKFPFALPYTMEALATMSQDDIVFSMNEYKELAGLEFIKRLNQMLLHKVIGNKNDGSDTDNTPNDGVRLLSIDRLTASSAEAAAFGAAGAEDIYTIDKSAEPMLDPLSKYVADGSGQSLDEPLLLEMINELAARGANTDVIVTGLKTDIYVRQLFQQYMRYMNPYMQEYKVQGQVGGVKTAQGLDVGINVAYIYEIPVIKAVDTPVDSYTTDGGTTWTEGLNRMYFLDTTDTEGYGRPRLGLSVLMPPTYFEGRDPVYLNKPIIKGIYFMMGELVTTAPRFQGKLRDLKP